MAKRRPGRRPRWRPRWTSLPGLGVGHGRARPPLRPVDERGPFPLAPQDRRALLPPGRHLQLHGGEDVPGGLHPLDLDAGDGHAPRGRDRVQVLEEGPVDPLPGREGLVEGELPHLFAQLRQAQVEYRVQDVLDIVPGRDRVMDPEVDHVLDVVPGRDRVVDPEVDRDGRHPAGRRGTRRRR